MANPSRLRLTLEVALMLAVVFAMTALGIVINSLGG